MKLSLFVVPYSSRDYFVWAIHNEEGNPVENTADIKAPEKLNKELDLANDPFARLHWIDFLRFMYITVVVLYHVRMGLERAGIYDAGPTYLLVENFIGGFSMAGFFFVSGLFIVYSASRDLKVFLKAKFQTIVWLYLVWAVIHCITQAAMSQWTNRARSFSDIWTLIYMAPDHYWFLYTLFFSMLLFALAIRLRISMPVFLGICIAFHLTSFFPNIYLGDWGVVYSIRRYIMYTALGAVIGLDGKPFRWLIDTTARNLVLLGIAGSAFVFMCAYTGLRTDPRVIPFQAIFGLIGSSSWAILLSRSGRFKFIEYIGRHSMYIYVAHVMGLAAMRIFLQKILGIEHALIHFVLGVAAAVYAPILLAIVADKFGMYYLFSLRKPKVPGKTKTQEELVGQPIKPQTSEGQSS